MSTILPRRVAFSLPSWLGSDVSQAASQSEFEDFSSGQRPTDLVGMARLLAQKVESNVPFNVVYNVENSRLSDYVWITNLLTTRTYSDIYNGVYEYQQDLTEPTEILSKDLTTEFLDQYISGIARNGNQIEILVQFRNIDTDYTPADRHSFIVELNTEHGIFANQSTFKVAVKKTEDNYQFTTLWDRSATNKTRTVNKTWSELGLADGNGLVSLHINIVRRTNKYILSVNANDEEIWDEIDLTEAEVSGEGAFDDDKNQFKIIAGNYDSNGTYRVSSRVPFQFTRFRLQGIYANNVNLSSLQNELDDLEDIVGQDGDPANEDGTIFSRLAYKKFQFGTVSDPPSTLGSVYARFNWAFTHIGQSSQSASRTGSLYRRSRQAFNELDEIDDKIGSSSDSATVTVNDAGYTDYTVDNSIITEIKDINHRLANVRHDEIGLSTNVTTPTTALLRYVYDEDDPVKQGLRDIQKVSENIHDNVGNVAVTYSEPASALASNVQYNDLGALTASNLSFQGQNLWKKSRIHDQYITRNRKDVKDLYDDIQDLDTRIDDLDVDSSETLGLQYLRALVGIDAVFKFSGSLSGAEQGAEKPADHRNQRE